ncbi:MAG: zinc metalloprotease [Erythrobacter sp. SCN 62-14]|nr:MAG: zinc metalloprotease [Erythrobacter sp. SCN 62-14]
MRLGPFDTSEIKVRQGGSGRAAGGLGCGTIVIALIAAVVFGVDPSQTLQMLEGIQQQQSQIGPTSTQTNVTADDLCNASAYANEACAALASLNRTWAPVFARNNLRFEQPELVLYPSGPVATRGCGNASSAAGPFYCPADMGIYLDTTFFDQLARMSGARISGSQGNFARLYVIGHEYGHHIQNITGINQQLRAAQRANPQAANRMQVAMELQADCLAGVWAGKNRDLLEAGDLEAGMMAASSIGDDTLSQGSGRAINPENFTHGSSQQRMEALRRGLESANMAECNVYIQAI